MNTDSYAVARLMMQFVIFNIINEEFAIDIKKVKEIIRVKKSTRVPQAPSFIQGVINLRGDVIPVVDLRKRFGLDATEITNETRTVIVEMRDDLLGLIVDAVTEVLRIDEEEIEPPPKNIAGLKAEYISGVGKVDERLLIILNIEKLLTSEERLKLESKDLGKEGSR